MLRLYRKIYEYMFITFNKNWPDDNPEWNASLVYSLMILFILLIISTELPLLYYLNKVVDARIAAVVVAAGNRYRHLNHWAVSSSWSLSGVIVGRNET